MEIRNDSVEFCENLASQMRHPIPSGERLRSIAESRFSSERRESFIICLSSPDYNMIYLLPSILSIIPSFFIVFNIGLVFMVPLLTGFHLILPHVLRQSPFKIPLHLSQIFLVVYLKDPSLAHFFSLFIQLLLALSSPRAQSNTTSMLMTPSYTFLLLLQIQLLHLKYFPILSLTYSTTQTLNFSCVHSVCILRARTVYCRSLSEKSKRT